MTIIVGNTERSELNAAVARARAHPVPWEVLRRVSEQDVEDQPLADEPPPPEFVDLPFGYVVAINFEEQPAGTCLHISVSGPWPRVAPNMVVCAMIFSALDVPEEADDVWTEEFLIDGKPGGRTLNVVWLVEPRNRDARQPAPRAKAQIARVAAPRTGRPSIDPVLMIRMLIVGYVFAIRSERRLCAEVQVNLAYRWFCKLGIEDGIPDHSVFSRARHERFRQSDALRRVFEGVVAKCIAAGLVGGEGFSIDASLIRADAGKKKRVPGDQPIAWPQAEEASRAVREYLAALDVARNDEENGGDDGSLSGGGSRHKPPKEVSLTDPQAAWVARKNTDPFFAYDANRQQSRDHRRRRGHTRQSDRRDCHHRDDDRSRQGALRSSATAVGR